MLYAIVGMLVIILDQGIKFWVTNHIAVDSVTQPLIPGVISLVRMHNDGAAFSFLAGGGARIYFIILTGIFAVAVVLALATGFISGRFGRWCLVLVTAGGLSNCLDRILYGFVVDMFKIELFDFAVFNVADIFITVFCLMFIVYIIFGGEDKNQAGDEFDEDDEDLDRPSYKESLKLERRQQKEDKAAARLAKRDKKRKAKYEEDEEDEFSAAFMPNRGKRPEAEAPARGMKRRAADEEEVPARGMKRRAAAPIEEEAAARGMKRRAAAPIEDEAPARSMKRRPAAPVEEEAPKRAARAPQNAAPAKKSRYEEEYEAFMASRPDARAEIAKSSSSQSGDPFAAWEQANARAETRFNSSYTAKAMGVAPANSAEEETVPVRRPAAPAAPAEAPRRQVRAIPEYDEAPAAPVRPAAPAPKPAPKVDDGMDFSLDDILSEFR